MGRRALSFGIVASAACLLAALPASAGSLPSSGSFVASDYSWDATSGGHEVVIAQGGTVTFSYPSGHSFHNAHFTTGNPSSCAQTAGDRSGSVPPLPHVPTGDGWAGSCTFGRPGTYKFHCDEHPFMTGTVAVQATGTSATSSPLAGPASRAVRVAPTQRGPRVRATIKVSSAGQGGSAQVKLSAPGSALGRRTAGPVTVGRISLTLHAGRDTVSVPLDRAARNALARRGRLKLRVQLVVRTPAGETAHAVRAVALAS